jgi:glycosyltransferase involved in cell wall biosynthesis
VSRIRVSFLIDKLHRAGAQVHLAELVRGLDRERFAPEVFCLMRGGPLLDALAAEGVAVSSLGLPTIYGPRAWRALARVVRHLRRERVDVVHCYLVSANIFGTLAARMAGVRVVTSRRDVGISRNWRLRLFEETIVNPLVDVVTANSASVAAAAARERFLSSERVRVIPNGVDLARFDPARHAREPSRAALGVMEADLVVGSVGHLSPVKGHADLLEAAAALVRRGLGVSVLLVGDGPLRAPLSEKATSLGIADRVLITGVRDDMPTVLAAMDAFALPSHTEGMSNALLEAMAMARPVVATAVDGNADVLRDGVTGRLVPPRNPEALAAALESVLADPAAARALGCAARRHVAESHALPMMVSRYEQLYEELARR